MCAHIVNDRDKINNGWLYSKNTVMGKLDPVFCTADYVNISPESNKVLNSTSTASSDICPCAILIHNRFDVFSVPDVHQDTGEVGSQCTNHLHKEPVGS